MKKILATSALAAVLAFSAEAKFEGFYAGAQTSYSKSTVSLKGAPRTGQTSKSTNPAGYALGLNGGYGCNMGAVYLGADLNAGYDWAKHTNGSTKFQAKNNWFAGLGARVGAHATDNWLAYLYLGVDYSRTKLSYSTSTQANYNKISKTSNVYSYVPGLGTSYKFSDNIYVDANYKYARSFSQSRPSHYVFAKSTQAHVFTIGAGYQF
ncbi:MAG: outer membrane beta-barrel protein [Alphaproteobacteria bacterium]